MPINPIIRILEADSNRQGDLFGRLMGDLFLALGYERVRLNIHKSGREIDIEAVHRTEKRRVIAECKATKDKTGGDEINKFIGSLDAEKRKAKLQTIGYFISLSGFKESTIEQEKDAGDERVVLLNGQQVVKELINGHIIVSSEKAMERAGRCAAVQPTDLMAEATFELLGHDIGWIWAIYFAYNKQKTHFALIHADGEAIAPALAESIIQADKSVEGILDTLIYLPPLADPSISYSHAQQAQEKYFEYLSVECGEIQLEGLPADQEVGSRRLKLENIFVPLNLELSNELEQLSLFPEAEVRKRDKKERYPVGQVLAEHSRLAILATPGGGKSTLLKRLAIAYAFPERRKLIDDELPDRTWLPLFIRCRQLGVLAKSSINDIFHALPKRAEMSDKQAEAFVLLVNETLRNGMVLLLVDGLDEISDEGTRISFVNQLRIFLATYPNVSIVVTSREAGFRIVGGALSSHCTHYRLADFDNNDIQRLTIAWHKEVVGERPEVGIEARKLAETICESNRVRLLAKNPLLLTTLLLVKRWVGQLPTRRSVLYGKAIEVLLMTWNVEAHQPIEQDEAIPQLAFLAFTMMKEGVQRISLRRLREVLTLARKQMPEVLAYARLSVSDFIERVELRSSLLMLSGHEIEQGTLYPMYEFQHLTFQEYLTARAIVEGYYPERKDDDSLLSILEPHLVEERWKEVVPLAAILAGRKVQPLIERLIELSKVNKSQKVRSKISPSNLLGQCILDEIQVSPDLLKQGLEWIARSEPGPSRLIIDLSRSKYGNILFNVIQDAFISSKTDLGNLGSALGEIALDKIGWGHEQDLKPHLVEKLETLLMDKNPIQRAAGALAIMNINYFFSFSYETLALQGETKKILKYLGDRLVPILYSEESYLYFAASWGFAWLGRTRTWTPEHKPEVLSRLIDIWRESSLSDTQRQAAWAIWTLPIIDRDLKPLPELDSGLIDFITNQFSGDNNKKRINEFSKRAALVLGYYCKAPWTDEELAQFVVSEYNQDSPHNPDKLIIESILEALGKPGKIQLEILKQEQDSQERKLRTNKKEQPTRRRK